MVRNFYKTLPLSDESRRILADLEHRIFELTEFLVRVCGRTSFGAVFNHRVTYHDSCHLRRELGIIEEPREILRHIEGLEFIEMDGSEDCCGFGGLFSLKYRELAADVARAKIRNASRTGAEYLVSCDAGCIQHIANALRQDDVSILPVHIASILRPERAAP
jgi:L-lactate dehydrogenase complex protein LldE